MDRTGSRYDEEAPPRIVLPDLLGEDGDDGDEPSAKSKSCAIM
eukprot:COSAG05_NODE_1697_length_4258_cov_7.337822_4_plen_43_part_00